LANIFFQIEVFYLIAIHHSREDEEKSHAKTQRLGQEQEEPQKKGSSGGKLR
jgi:hypothetical protein